MKKITNFLLIAVLSAFNLGAETETGSNYSITSDFTYVSEYVSRGIGVTEASIQPSIEFSAEGFYITAWTNQPLTNNSVSDEFDFFVGYSWSLDDSSSLDVGAITYYFPKVESSNSSIEPYIGFSIDTFFGLGSSTYLYYDVILDVSTFQFDLSYSVEMTDSLTLDLGGNYGIVAVLDGDQDYKDYTYHGFSGVISYAFNDKVVPYMGIAYSNRNIKNVKEDFVYYIFGITVGFVD
jgi:uncharacterized protein (TIGR02001 family)